MIQILTDTLALKYFAACANEQSFLGIQGWYKYVPRGTQYSSDGQPIGCQLDFGQAGGLNAVWLVVAGILDILLRVSAIIAIVFFIIGAFKMVTSQGSPEGVKNARNTMVNALIGLVITVVSAWFVSYLMGTILK